MDHCIIATMGPEGTDSAHLANRLSSAVELLPTFRCAMERSIAGEAAALVPCGAGSIASQCSDTDGDRWVDLNFEFFDNLVIAATFAHATKAMCIARRRTPTGIGGIALHPATLAFARRFAEEEWVRSAPNKVDAVHACLRGETDFCIGSTDVVERHPELVRIVEFAPPMVWTIYCRPALQQAVGNLMTQFRTRQ